MSKEYFMEKGNTMAAQYKLARVYRVNKKRIVSTALFGLAIVGCAAGARVTTVDRTFIEDADINSKIDNLPFDHAWVRNDFDGRGYSKLYFPPIRTDLLGKDNKWERSIGPIISNYEEYQSEAKQIAEFFHSELVKKFSEYEGNRIRVVDGPGKDVVTIEVALTELEFSHPAARAAALAAPVPGTGVALSTITDPHMAFAARIYDPKGKLVGTAADRKFPPTRIVDLNKLTVTSANREISSIWAETFAEAINKGRFQKTGRKGIFSILPW
jgi:hypothetical protein